MEEEAVSLIEHPLGLAVMEQAHLVGLPEPGAQGGLAAPRGARYPHQGHAGVGLSDRGMCSSELF